MQRKQVMSDEIDQDMARRPTMISIFQPTTQFWRNMDSRRIKIFFSNFQNENQSAFQVYEQQNARLFCFYTSFLPSLMGSFIVNCTPFTLSNDIRFISWDVLDGPIPA